ncbi:MAG: hypothetical protein K8M05_40380 [Deltaproteobacteria bacterium]|nr:hypothetical protein [Kofleriaceae bacterium]
MLGGPHTHRDTLAFALTILGASFWALFPAAMLLRDNGVGPELGFPAVMVTGALLGSWAGASLWRHVAWPTPLVAAGLVAATFIVVRQEYRGQGIGPLHFTCVASAVAGAALGARIGWRTRVPQRALAMAFIALAGPATVLLAIAVVAVLGYEGNEGVLGWSVLLSIIPAASIAARLGGPTPPERFALCLFGMLSLAVAAALHRQPEYGLAKGILMGLFFAGIQTLVATIPVRRHFLRRPVRDELPPAQVVER